MVEVKPQVLDSEEVVFSRKVHILGGAGFIGSSLELGLPTRRVAREGLDITVRDQVLDYFERERLAVVILAAAYTDVNRAEAERDEAWRVNVRGAANVAEACNRFYCRLIYLSTDFVFTGEEGPYSESQKPPHFSKKRGAYGDTKFQAEQAIQGSLRNFAICRIAYPFGVGHGKDFVLKTIEFANKYPLFSDQIITPTYVPDLSTALQRLVVTGERGFFHVACNPLTPFEVGNYLNLRLNLDLEIREGSLAQLNEANKEKPVAQRPLKGGLLAESTQKRLDIKFQTWKEAVEEMIERGLLSVQ